MSRVPFCTGSTRDTRALAGDFAEIVHKIQLNENIAVVEPEELLALDLSEEGQLAREILLNDLELLTAHGASPHALILSGAMTEMMPIRFSPPMCIPGM